MLRLSLILVFFMSVASMAAESFLDINDVSVLFPLPDSQNWTQLPGGLTAGKKGILLPVQYLKEVPRLITQSTNENLYSSLHVMGIRIDPCFHEGRAPLRCRAQIRMIWQPLKLEENITSTFDASLHTFYDLSRDEMKELLSDLADLKKTKSDMNLFLPLGVNPYIKQEGLQGVYAQKLISLILKYVGESNLSRLTFMQLFMNENVWIFGGFDVSQGILTSIQIPRTEARSQMFGNSATARPFWFLGGMSPEPNDSENLNILIKDSRVLGPQNEAEIVAATRAAFRFENPEMHNPGTTDCVSCHLAQPAKTWALRQYPWLQLDTINQKEIYTSDRDLRNLSPMQIHTNIVRSFGYFMNRPFVAQRTINESAAVIKYINENF